MRKFITNLAFLLLLNLMVKPVWIFVFDRNVQEVLGNAEYGLYAALLNFTFLFSILPDLGINLNNTRKVATDSNRLKTHLPGLISLKLLLSVAYFLVIVVIGACIGYTGIHMELLFWLGINQILISFIQFFRSSLSGLHLFKQDSMLSVLDRSLMMIMCGVLLWGGVSGGEFEIRWFVWLQTVGYGITALVALFLVLRQSGKIKLEWKWSFYRKMIRESLPFAVLVVLMSMYSRSDMVMLERMLEDGDRQAGIYAQSYRLLDAINMFAMLFSVLLIPIFSRMIAKKEAVGDLVKLAYKMLMGVAVIVGVACFYFNEEIIELLYSEDLTRSAQVFAVLMFSFMAMVTTYVFGSLLTANGDLKLLNWMAFGTLILNVGLNFWLIPEYGVLGATWTTLITQGIIALLQI